MGFLSRFENKVEDTFEGAAGKMFDAPISPVQIAKKAEKQMRREKMVGAGKQYAPTLYTVLVNPDDDNRLFGYYPTLAGETETYLAAKAAESGLVMDGQPLVRFIVDEDLKHGKFDVIAETVAAPIVMQLRDEEMQRYGIAPQSSGRARNGYAAPRDPYAATGNRNMPGAYNAPAPSAQPASHNDYDSWDNAALPANPAPNRCSPSFIAAGYDADAAFEAAGAAGVASGAAGAAASAASAAGAGAALAAAGAAAPNPEPYAAPNTVAFAAGAGNAAPLPSQQAAQARLLDLTNNRTYALASQRLLIGREGSCDITLPDINASRTHAELRREAQGVWVLSDLGSTNGTTVNGVGITTAPLYEGDHITIGMTNLQFTQQ